MESYRELQARQQKEVNEFPLSAAFSDRQFDEMMRNWGFNPKHTYKVCSIGSGMFCKKSDLDNLKKMFRRHRRELETRLKADEDFAYEAFTTEMYNHECGYTGNFSEATEALGLSTEQITDNTVLARAYIRARDHVLANA